MAEVYQLGPRSTNKNSGSKPDVIWIGILATIAMFWLLLGEPLRMINIQGPVAAGMAIVILALLPAAFITGEKARTYRGYMALVAFLIWAFFVSIAKGSDKFGLQNLSIYVLFVGIIVLVCAGAINVEFGRILTIARWLAFLGSVPFFFLDLIGSSDDGRVIGTGALPGIASIGLVLCITSKRTKLVKAMILVLSVVIFFSLSRAYIVFALACLAIPSLQIESLKKFISRVLFRFILVSIVGVVAMTQYPPLKNRFIINDGQSIAGLDIGTSGRNSLWDSLWMAIREGDLVFGNGAGAAEKVVTESFFGITQPHNDYLRILCDFGIVGLILWVISMAGIFFVIFKKFLKSYGTNQAPLHLSSTMVMLLIVGSSFLDNVVIYVFIMVPAAVLIGLSLGWRSKAALVSTSHGDLAVGPARF